MQDSRLYLVGVIGKNHVAEPENKILRLLRELRNDIKNLDRKVDRNHGELKEHLEALRKAFAG